MRGRLCGSPREGLAPTARESVGGGGISGTDPNTEMSPTKWTPAEVHVRHSFRTHGGCVAIHRRWSSPSVRARRDDAAPHMSVCCSAGTGGGGGGRRVWTAGTTRGGVGHRGSPCQFCCFARGVRGWSSSKRSVRRVAREMKPPASTVKRTRGRLAPHSRRLLGAVPPSMRRASPQPCARCSFGDCGFGIFQDFFPLPK